MHEIIEPRGLAVADAAEAMGVELAELSAFLNERERLSFEMARRLDKAFGVSMETLMRMQRSYDEERSGVGDGGRSQIR